jgi:hypothetical protein
MCDWFEGPEGINIELCRVLTRDRCGMLEYVIGDRRNLIWTLNETMKTIR